VFGANPVLLNANRPAAYFLILGNIVGLGVGPLLDVWGLLTGARQLAAVFGAIHLSIALAFIWAWRGSIAAKASR